MEDLTCSVCSEVFEGGVREPVVLPQCGHTFCRPCLLNLQDIDPAFKCPTCRSPHSGLPVDNLPVVYAILNVVATYSNMPAQPRVTWEECQSHGDPVRLWCQPCQEPLCGQCLYDGHMREGHHVLRTQTALDHEKQVLTSQAARVTKLIEDKRKHLTQEFHEVSLHLADIYRRTRSLSHYSKTVSDVLQTTQETNHMKTLIMNRRMMENLLARLEASDRNSCVSDLASRTVPAEPAPGGEEDGARGTKPAVKEDLEPVAEGRTYDSDTDDDGSEPSQVRGQEASVSRDDGRDPQVSQDHGRDSQVSQGDGRDPQVSWDDGRDPQVSQGDGRDPQVSQVDGRDLQVSHDDGCDPQVSQVDGRDPQVSQDDGRDPQVSQGDGDDPQVSWDDGRDPQVSQGDGRDPQVSQVDGRDLQVSHDDGRDPQVSQVDGRDPQVSHDDGRDPQVSQGAGDDPQVSQGDGRDTQVSQGAGDDPQVSQGAGDDPQVSQGAGDDPQVSQGDGRDTQVSQGAGDDPQVSQGARDDPQVSQGAVDDPQVSQGAGDDPQVSQGAGDDPQVSQGAVDDPQVSQRAGDDPQVSQGAGDEPDMMRVESEEGGEAGCCWWRLSRCSPGGATRWPRLNWYDFMTQLPVVQLLVPPEKPEVFLQLGVGERSLGRVHIRLWGHLRRAQHFLALCLSTLGPSYRGSRFSYVARKGKPGERLVGGVYLTEDGSSSSHQLIQGLEWRGEYLGPAREGTVGGSRGRQAKFNSCFCISSRDNPIGQYYCPFGEVVSGLEVVRAAVQHDPVTDVAITDAGLIVPHV